jgi:hypothetical protein
MGGQRLTCWCVQTCRTFEVSLIHPTISSNCPLHVMQSPLLSHTSSRQQASRLRTIEYPHGLFGVAWTHATPPQNQGMEWGSFGVIVEIVIARATTLGLIAALWVFGEG